MWGRLSRARTWTGCCRRGPPSPDDLLSESELVVAGPYGWGSETTLAQLRNPPKASARYLGYVAEEYLPGADGGALLTAYPSLYEGFGFPVAQSMAAGVAVLTSNSSCLPEVAGDEARSIRSTLKHQRNH